MRAQTQKTTFSCKDDYTLKKHTWAWTYSALQYLFYLYSVSLGDALTAAAVRPFFLSPAPQVWCMKSHSKHLTNADPLKILNGSGTNFKTNLSSSFQPWKYPNIKIVHIFNCGLFDFCCWPAVLNFSTLFGRLPSLFHPQLKC